MADGLTSFYGGFVVFAIIGFMANDIGQDIKDVAVSGTLFLCLQRGGRD